MIISCDSELMNAYLDGIQVELENYYTKKQEVEACVDTICKSSWNGSASEYFETQMKDFIEDLDNVYSCLKDYHAYIKGYVSGGQEVEKEYNTEIEIK